MSEQVHSTTMAQAYTPPQMIHQHLCEVNSEYAALNVVMLPWWVRPENELTNQPYSSVVFAVDSFDQHAHFLRTAKTMAAFGRLATTREWADCLPITQYYCCWHLDHCTTTCQQPLWCRICGEEHEKSHHHDLLAPTIDDCRHPSWPECKSQLFYKCIMYKLQTCRYWGHYLPNKLNMLSEMFLICWQPTRQDKVKAQI